MKLASLRGGRDGRLVVVSRDLGRAVLADDVAPTLQRALDDWDVAAPRLREVAEQLEAGRLDAMPFDEAACVAPLPRACQWLDGSAYLNHVELVRRARGAELPAELLTDPLMYQGGSDDLLAGHADVPLGSEDWGIDFEGEVAVITGDVPMGTPAAAALGYVRLIVLVNDVSLRNLIPGELAKGFGFVQSKPATSFAPVAVTPNELGEAWREGRVHLPLSSYYNGVLFGRPDAGRDMTFSFADLIAHAARTRNLGAGTIIGSGTVSNRQGPPGSDHGSAIEDGGVGYSCIAERRCVETIGSGAPRTPFMRFGDRIRMEMRDRAGRSVFGAIDQCMIRSATR